MNPADHLPLTSGPEPADGPDPRALLAADLCARLTGRLVRLPRGTPGPRAADIVAFQPEYSPYSPDRLPGDSPLLVAPGVPGPSGQLTDFLSPQTDPDLNETLAAVRRQCRMDESFGGVFCQELLRFLRGSALPGAGQQPPPGRPGRPAARRHVSGSGPASPPGRQARAPPTSGTFSLPGHLQDFLTEALEAAEDTTEFWVPDRRRALRALDYLILRSASARDHLAGQLHQLVDDLLAGSLRRLRAHLRRTRGPGARRARRQAPLAADSVATLVEPIAGDLLAIMAGWCSSPWGTVRGDIQPGTAGTAVLPQGVHALRFNLAREHTLAHPAIALWRDLLVGAPAAGTDTTLLATYCAVVENAASRLPKADTSLRYAERLLLRVTREQLRAPSGRDQLRAYAAARGLLPAAAQPEQQPRPEDPEEEDDFDDVDAPSPTAEPGSTELPFEFPDFLADAELPFLEPDDGPTSSPGAEPCPDVPAPLPENPDSSPGASAAPTPGALFPDIPTPSTVALGSEIVSLAAGLTTVLVWLGDLCACPADGGHTAALLAQAAGPLSPATFSPHSLPPPLDGSECLCHLRLGSLPLPADTRDQLTHLPPVPGGFTWRPDPEYPFSLATLSIPEPGRSSGGGLLALLRGFARALLRGLHACRQVLPPRVPGRSTGERPTARHMHNKAPTEGLADGVQSAEAKINERDVADLLQTFDTAIETFWVREKAEIHVTPALLEFRRSLVTDSREDVPLRRCGAPLRGGRLDATKPPRLCTRMVRMFCASHGTWVPRDEHGRALAEDGEPADQPLAGSEIPGNLEQEQESEGGGEAADADGAPLGAAEPGGHGWGTHSRKRPGPGSQEGALGAGKRRRDVPIRFASPGMPDPNQPSGE